jgi:hypothetical protein
MDYSSRVAANEPIGSGVTEAACKVIVKQRLCGSGMKWTEDGAAVVLSLRALSYTPERTMESVLVEGGSMGVPGRRLNEVRLGITSILDQTSPKAPRRTRWRKRTTCTILVWN